jgi:hypothetical protein
MKWWWSERNFETLTETEFFDLLEYTLCANFVEYLDIIGEKGYLIPFVATTGLLSHKASRSSFLPQEDHSTLQN